MAVMRAVSSDKSPGQRRPPFFVELRRAVGTRPRRWLLAITLVLGLLSAIAVTLGLPPADRTFATIGTPVQLLMSVTVPFFGVLLTAGLAA
jgi:hypothetical protein